MAVGPHLRNAATTARSIAGTYPATFRVWAAVQHRRAPDAQAFIDDDTRIVVDGYAGSANSFTVAAIRAVESRDFPIAHHLHAAAAIKITVRRDLPHIVLIRRPLDATASNLRRFPHVTARQSLRGWLRYYEALLDLRSELLVADFDEVSHDINHTFERVNARWPATLRATELDEAVQLELRPPQGTTHPQRAQDGGAGVDVQDQRIAELLARADQLYRTIQS